MCGITGFWAAPDDTREKLTGQALSMNDALVHRGPDAGGVWVDECIGIGLGNRRLAILDLSASGTQPMFSRCGRYCIVYNGEVYNFGSLRKELENEGKQFISQTDTEVMV